MTEESDRGSSSPQRRVSWSYNDWATTTTTMTTTTTIMILFFETPGGSRRRRRRKKKSKRSAIQKHGNVSKALFNFTRSGITEKAYVHIKRYF